MVSIRTVVFWGSPTAPYTFSPGMVIEVVLIFKIERSANCKENFKKKL